ncbi:MAG: DEAD/DEAH box helicase [Thermoprotei archaeon]|nr:DEAD/DEAH box helicase [TACK group archaeon]
MEATINPLVKKLFESRFGSPSLPQELAMPHVLAGENILLIAPTGTGKTEAALIPVLSGIVDRGRVPGMKALYITPLRALNRDMMDRISWWSARLDIKVAVRHGDTATAERAGQSKMPPDILITTPETLQAILTGKLLMKGLQSLSWVIVDEVHELASTKRGAQLAVGLERLRKQIGHDFQVIGLSATVGSPEEVGKFLSGDRQITVLRADLDKRYQVSVLYPSAGPEDEALAKKLYTVPEVAARLRAMKQAMEGTSTVLLFTNTRSVAEALTNRFHMWDQEFAVGIHHGSLARSTRLGVEKAMKEGSLRGVICTSSLELGIDVGSVDLVIQYNSPRQVTRLVQRVGRAEHSIGGESRGIIVTMDGDDTLEALAITRRLMSGELEPVKVLSSPLDVAMHQLAGLVIARRKLTLDEALRSLRRAYPFRDLNQEELRQLVEYMSERRPRLLFMGSDGTISKPIGKKALYTYYFDNLSMIPEEKQYLVLEEVEGRQEPVGVLDEAFVSENGVPGTKFVMTGSVWEIRQVYEGKVFVKKAKDPLGAIPSWEGEEIPVPTDVAQEVGRMRRFAEEGLRSGKKVEDVARELGKTYPWASHADLCRALSDVEVMASRDIPVPSDKRLFVEVWQNYVTVHTHAGLLENRCLSRAFSELISRRTRSSLQVSQDAYRWTTRFPEGLFTPQEELELALSALKDMREMGASNFSELVEEAVLPTGLYKRRLVNAGRKMGAISKDADLTSVGLDQLAARLKGTVIDKQARRDVFTFDVNLEGAVSFLEEDREITGRVLEEPSPLALSMLESGMKKQDVMAADRIKLLLEASVRQRLYHEPVVVTCTACGQYVEQTTPLGLDDHPTCPVCGSSRLGVTRQDQEKVWRAVASHGSVEPRLYSELMSSAELVSTYGRRAALALAGHGVRLSEARDMLARAKDEDELVRLIMEAEKRNLARRFSQNSGRSAGS